MRVELVTPCPNCEGDPHKIDRWTCHVCEGFGGSRSTVSGFSPEAVQAAIVALNINRGSRTTEALVEAALAAAWATDFGDPA